MPVNQDVCFLWNPISLSLSLSYNTISSRNNSQLQSKSSAVTDSFRVWMIVFQIKRLSQEEVHNEDRSLMSITVSLGRDCEEPIFIHQTLRITCGSHTDSVMILMESNCLEDHFVHSFHPQTTAEKTRVFVFVDLSPSLSLFATKSLLNLNQTPLFIFLSQ